MKRITKNNKKALSMALAAAMAIAPVNAFAASSDIHGHWAEKTITAWQDKGLISGYQDGTFKPNKPTTRAEFARIMNQALGLSNKGNVSFSDVSASDWFYNDVAVALGEKYTAGYPDGTFKPNETITRAQAAVFIAKAIDASGGSVAAFTDSNDIPNWAKDSVGAIVAKGYMSGYPDGSFKPNAVLTRAEAVSTLNRIMGITTPEEEETTDKDVVIDKDDTKLKDQTIEGNLIISEKVGDGEVYLDNVEIKGDLIIQGGGDDSIYVEDTIVNGKTVLEKKNVRLQVSGKTELSTVEIKKACKFNSNNFSGNVGKIYITTAISDKITVSVEADKLYVDEKANLLITKDIDDVIIDKDAAGTKLEVDEDAKVSTVTADGEVALSGKGKISTLEANVDDITYTSGLTISKTETAKGVDEPTKASSSGSSSSSSSSSKKRTKSVDTVDEFEEAVASNSISTIYVTGDISGAINATRTGTRSLTISFAKHTMGNVTITAPEVTSIYLNDSGAEDAGASITNLTIDAPKAHVENSVEVTGDIIIKAVSSSTLKVKDAAQGIKMQGPGRLEVISSLPTPPPVSVETADNVQLAGTLGTVNVNTTGANVEVVNGAAVNQISVPFTSTGATITTKGTVAQIQTAASVAIAGSGTVANVDATENGIKITVNGTATVSNVNAVGVTGIIIDGTSTHKPATATSKAAAPTSLVGVAPTTSANNDGRITGVDNTMEYKLSTDSDYSAITGTEITGLVPGTYYVRVKAVEGADPVLASNPVKVVVNDYETPDTTAPVITASDVTVVVADLSAWTETVSASDDVDGNISSSVVATYFESNGTTSLADLAAAKTYIGDASVNTSFVIKYNVSDAAGNAATEKIVTITVTPADTTAPVITASDATVAVADLSAWTETVSASDDVDGNISSSVVATYFESNGTTSLADLAAAKT
ncbi:S-layer homology domain-containing protein, partial [Anaerotignum sp.]|uniref:S-layer homology domain-containing protein n=1 Tax=Anaerotignum sp. TaxID=2039241 RepID=UPI002714BEC4